MSIWNFHYHFINKTVGVELEHSQHIMAKSSTPSSLKVSKFQILTPLLSSCSFFKKLLLYFSILFFCVCLRRRTKSPQLINKASKN